MVYRVLVVEDDRARAERLSSWMPPGFRAVVVASAGTALGVLERTEQLDFAAVMLDHDLQQRAATDHDLELSGSSIVGLLARKISHDVPILVHSMNVVQGPAMAARLADAGFEVLRHPMDQLTAERLGEWLKAAAENYDGLLEQEG